MIVILGDQLNLDSEVFKDLDTEHDCIWMAEVPAESTHVWSHKARILLFLSAMRNFCRVLRSRGYWIIYHKLGTHQHTSMASALAYDLRKYRPQSVQVVQPGEYRILDMIKQTAASEDIDLVVKKDTHFLIDLHTFEDWTRDVKQLRQENFYRRVRRKTAILMENDQPAGGQWNFDHQNRNSFTRQGPGILITPRLVKQNTTTNRVREEIEAHFPNHPGSTDNFTWPVTRTQAQEALQEFIDNRLYSFGRYQDAMWTGHPFLFHSRLSTALNLKLLSPQEVVTAVMDAWKKKHAPIESVEGFIRQVIGWREYIHGIYWKYMPDYAGHNALSASLPLPDFYWTAETDMVCMRETISQVLAYGYAHHIQRLMVTGLFALLLGVKPQQVHEWYLAMFVDAVEWVELPNTLGMSQYADDGLLASKPYIASGKYIQRMSNYCSQCRYNPANATGDDACPFTTLYWDFLIRHKDKFEKHPRAGLQWRNLQKMDKQTQHSIQIMAEHTRNSCYDRDAEQCVTPQQDLL
jgi:deoxyribodipyrimidine photolyase-related protein